MQLFTRILNVLGVPIRLRLLRLVLSAKQEVRGGELVGVFGLPHYALSRHLNALQRVGLLQVRKAGRSRFYTTAKTPDPAIRLLYQAVRRLEDEGVLVRDLQRLDQRLAMRGLPAPRRAGQAGNGLRRRPAERPTPPLPEEASP